MNQHATMAEGPGRARVDARVVVGRQGIYDVARNRIGYELLFRVLPPGPDRPITGAEMTAEVVYTALSLGLDQVAQDRLVFCNADRAALLSELLYTLPTDCTVIEVLESVEIDDEIVAACRSLTAAGYTLALDDFVWRPRAEELLELVSIVKLDVLHTGPAELADLVDRCRGYGVTLLAEKVERLGDIDRLVAEGFTLFQGYALERPQIIDGSTIGPNDLSRLRTAIELLDSDVEFERIEAILRADPGLSLQVIRLASSGRLGESARRVGNLREALVLAGTRQVQNWVALLLARPGRVSDPAEVVNILIRARACELLAGAISLTDAPLGFAAGMLSAIDGVFRVPRENIRAALPLTAELDAAAFGACGPVGQLVSDATDFQLGKADAVRRSAVDPMAMHAAFAEAYRWAMDSLGTPVGATR